MPKLDADLLNEVLLSMLNERRANSALSLLRTATLTGFLLTRRISLPRPVTAHFLNCPTNITGVIPDESEPKT